MTDTREDVEKHNTQRSEKYVETSKTFKCSNFSKSSKTFLPHPYATLA